MPKVTIQGSDESLKRINAQEGRTDAAAAGRAPLGIPTMPVGSARASAMPAAPAAPPVAPAPAPTPAPSPAPAASPAPAPAPVPKPAAPAPAAQPAPARPTELEGTDFQSVGDVVVSYREAQAAIARQGEELRKLREQIGAAKPSEKPPEGTQAPAPALRPGGLSAMTPEEAHAFDKSWNDNKGKLSEDDYKKLETEFGAPRRFVDEWYRGRIADRNEGVRRVHETAGGADRFKTLMEWAASGKAGFSEQDARVLNAQLQSDDVEEVIAGVRNVDLRYKAVNGAQGTIQAPADGGSDGKPDVYADQTEYQADQRKAATLGDPKFSAYIIEKMKRSLAGWKQRR